MSEQPPGDRARLDGSFLVRCDCGHYEAWVQQVPGTCPAKAQYPDLKHRVRDVPAG